MEDAEKEFEKEFTAAYRKFFLMIIIMTLAIFGLVFGLGILELFLGGAKFLLVLIPILALVMPLLIFYFIFIKGGLYSKLYKSSIKMYGKVLREGLSDRDVYYKEHLKNKLREELKEELKREMLEEMKKKELCKGSKEEPKQEVSQKPMQQEQSNQGF